jgi:gas vesicle protein
MKKMYSAALLIGAAFVVQQANAACDYPVAPGKIPDGSVASREEMLASKKEVTKYDADMNTYLVCIRTEFDASLAAKPDTTPDQKKQMEKVHGQKEEAALAEVQDVVGRLNEQLKAWKAKNSPEKKS